MRRFFSLFALAAVASACGKDDAASSGTPSTPAATGVLSAQTILVEGKTRSYELSVPSDYDGAKALPLVFVFHGSGGNGAGIRKSFALEGAATGDGALFVYPDGLERRWNLNDEADKNADIKLFDALVASLSETYRVDDKRIFATGYSNGGYFANQLGCRRGSVLRGIATHASGGPYGGTYDSAGKLVCPEPPVAALASHGQADGTVKLSEGYKSRDHWRAANGCGETTKPRAPSPCVEYTGCAAGRPVVWCEVPGVGHSVWPAEGARVTWSFFAGL